MADGGLAGWAVRQPAWVQDALQRIATAGSVELEPEQIEAIRERVLHEARGGSEAGPACTAFDPACLDRPAADGAGKTTLLSLGPVNHVDRLAADQTLRFAVDGVTLVYGDNGSGKSGYARLAKRLCRSLSSDPLRSNVFEAAKTPGAKVRFRIGSEDPQDIAWTEGEPPPACLRSISVFDSQNARLYVDEQNRVSYLPAELAVLEQHGAICTQLSSQFEALAKELDRRLKTPAPAGFGDGEIGQLVRSMEVRSPSLPNAEQLRGHAVWTPELLAERQALEAQLAQDPAVHAATRRRAAAVLRRLVEVLAPIELSLSAAAEAELRKLAAELQVAEGAVAASAGQAFAGEPLPGVGGETWRALFEAARAFALGTSEGSDLLAGEDDLCALCQEPLGPEGAARVSRFNAFMRAEVSKAADSARAAFDAATAALNALSIPPPLLVHEQLAAFAQTSAARSALAERIVASVEAWTSRRSDLASTRDPGAAIATAPPASLQAELEDQAAALAGEADALEQDATRSAQLDAARRRLSDLKDKEKLSEELSTLLQRLEDLEQLAHLKACCAQLSTGGISRQLTTLRKAVLTEALQERVASEIAYLDLGHLPFEMIDSSAAGQSFVGVGLRGVKKVRNSQVLSEGEQRALALACFLAEVADHGAGIIVDDPVSSLDHQRVRRVARRLVAEAGKGRQVIVFTHNIVFFNEVISEAAKAQTPLLKAVVRKTEADGHGVIAEDVEPWVVREVKTRIGELSSRAAALAKGWDIDEEQKRRLAKDFYSDLRETWERTVEEVVFCKTVQRLDPAVMTQSLKGVRVEDDDYRVIYFAMKRASERSGHDLAAARDIPIPTPGEMKVDVEALDAFVKDYKKRAKTLDEQRRALEKPLPATLG